MILQYYFGGKQSTIIANWTDFDGHSAIYQDIVGKLEAKHGIIFSGYLTLARDLDAAVDKLYEYIYIFGDEHHAIPYNPKFRKQFLQAYSVICDILSEHLYSEKSEAEETLATIFVQILDKLQELVGVYLVDNAYQGKHRYRRKNFEEWAETTDEKRMQYEFETVVLQMSEISSMLDCLTDTQRRRLVKHLFLKYTMQEIADQEHVTKQSVEESISSALRKFQGYM